MATIEELCREHDLLTLGKDNIVRVPFLIKGTLRVPPVVGMERIQEAFSAKEEGDGKTAQCRYHGPVGRRTGAQRAYHGPGDHAHYGRVCLSGSSCL